MVTCKPTSIYERTCNSINNSRRNEIQKQFRHMQLTLLSSLSLVLNESVWYRGKEVWLHCLVHQCVLSSFSQRCHVLCNVTLYAVYRSAHCFQAYCVPRFCFVISCFCFCFLFPRLTAWSQILYWLIFLFFYLSYMSALLWMIFSLCFLFRPTCDSLKKFKWSFCFD